jgi:hypothetical protein
MTSESQPNTSVTVEVERNERGWMVVHVVDGERKTIEPPYADRESAESAATAHDQASDRWTGAAEHVSPEERPENRTTEQA